MRTYLLLSIAQAVDVECPSAASLLRTAANDGALDLAALRAIPDHERTEMRVAVRTTWDELAPWVRAEAKAATEVVGTLAELFMTQDDLLARRPTIQ